MAGAKVQWNTGMTRSYPPYPPKKKIMLDYSLLFVENTTFLRRVTLRKKCQQMWVTVLCYILACISLICWTRPILVRGQSPHFLRGVVGTMFPHSAPERRVLSSHVTATLPASGVIKENLLLSASDQSVENLTSDILLRWDDSTINSHFVTRTFSLRGLGEFQKARELLISLRFLYSYGWGLHETLIALLQADLKT